MIWLGIALALAAFVALLVAPSHPSLREEERQLRERLRARDKAERQGWK